MPQKIGKGGYDNENYDPKTGQYTSNKSVYNRKLEHRDDDVLGKITDGEFYSARNSDPKLADSSIRKKQRLVGKRYEDLKTDKKKREGLDLKVVTPYFEKYLFQEISKTLPFFKRLHKVADPNEKYDMQGIDYISSLEGFGDKKYMTIDLKNTISTIGDRNSYENWNVAMKLMTGDKEDYLLRKNLTNIYCFTCFDCEGTKESLYNSSRKTINENGVYRAKALICEKETIKMNLYQRLQNGRKSFDVNDENSLINQLKNKLFESGKNSINFPIEDGLKIVVKKEMQEGKETYSALLIANANHLSQICKSIIVEHNSPEYQQMIDDNEMMFNSIQKAISNQEISKNAYNSFKNKLREQGIKHEQEIKDYLEKILNQNSIAKRKYEQLKRIQSKGFSG